jgi:hypothetical protein
MAAEVPEASKACFQCLQLIIHDAEQRRQKNENYSPPAKLGSHVQTVHASFLQSLFKDQLKVLPLALSTLQQALRATVEMEKCKLLDPSLVLQIVQTAGAILKRFAGIWDDNNYGSSSSLDGSSSGGDSKNSKDSKDNENSEESTDKDEVAVLVNSNEELNKSLGQCMLLLLGVLEATRQRIDGAHSAIGGSQSAQVSTMTMTMTMDLWNGFIT